MSSTSTRSQLIDPADTRNARHNVVDFRDVKAAAGDGQFRGAFSSSAVGVAVLTPDARFLQVNRAFCSLTGYSAAELLTKDCIALIHPDDRTQSQERLAQFLAGEAETLVLEHRYSRKNSETIRVRTSLSLTRDVGNRPASIVAISREITGRRRLEECMPAGPAQSEEELSETELLQELSAELIEQGDERALHEKIVEVIATIMRSDFATMQAFHPKRGQKGELHLLASCGLTPEAQKVWEWVTFDTDSTCGQALRTGARAIASDVETSDFLGGTPGGKKLLEAGIRAAQSTPLFSRSGNFMGMVSSHWREPHTPTDRDLRFLDILARQAADLIERQRAESELRRLNKDLEDFAYTASHDLQEPLRTVKIYSELLRARCGEELKGETAVYLGFMRSAATRMEMLIRDLLDYTQIDRGQESGAKISAEIPLGHALANLAAAIEESKAGVRFDSLPDVCIREMHLRQLFQNLIGNAIKYRHPGRDCRVRIGAERNDGFWVFSVSDNGVGIEPAYKDRIFGLFTRLGAKDDSSGTGLGLAICKRIIERYQGRIWVESEPGIGSAFRFSLPA